MRIDKYLSHAGFGSRNDVKKLIKQKHVFVNNTVIKNPGHILNLDSDSVSVDGEIITYEVDVYYMMNKPSGYICSHDYEEYPSVLELLHDFRNDLVMVGRLDVDTEGLLLITNDGQFSHRVAHGKKEIYKTYYVELAQPFDMQYITKLESGINLGDFECKPTSVEMITDTSLNLSIAEGKYHQVKRMMHACDNEVTYLKRIKIGNLCLDETLDYGEYRTLTQEEIDLFK